MYVRALFWFSFYRPTYTYITCTSFMASFLALTDSCRRSLSVGGSIPVRAGSQGVKYMTCYCLWSLGIKWGPWALWCLSYRDGKEPPLALIKRSPLESQYSTHSGWTANACGTNKFSAPNTCRQQLSCILLGELKGHWNEQVHKTRLKIVKAHRNVCIYNVALYQ